MHGSVTSPSRKEESMENRLTVLRAERKLSQAQLAKDAGISRTTLSAIENGNVKPDFDTIAKLVKALNVPANAIFLALDVV